MIRLLSPANVGGIIRSAGSIVSLSAQVEAKMVELGNADYLSAVAESQPVIEIAVPEGYENLSRKEINAKAQDELGLDISKCRNIAKAFEAINAKLAESQTDDENADGDVGMSSFGRSGKAD